MRALLLPMFCLVSAVAMAVPKTIASGSLKHNGMTYPYAIITFDSDMDATGTGNNPGLEVWSDKSMTLRLLSSRDNNAAWDYNPVAAFFENGQAVVIGIKDATDFSRSVGRVWRSTTTSILEQSAAQFDYINEAQETDVFQAGSFYATKRDRRVPVYVEHNRVKDYSQSGSYPSLTIRHQNTGAILWEARDSNVSWDYSMFVAFAFEGKIYITGARRDNTTGQFFPRIWTTDGTINAKLRQRKNGI